MPPKLPVHPIDIVRTLCYDTYIKLLMYGRKDTTMDMTTFAGKQVIINVTEDWGETQYSISFDGRAMVGADRAKWEATIQQLRDAGAIIIDNAAIKAERDAAIAAMKAKMGKI